MLNDYQINVENIHASNGSAMGLLPFASFPAGPEDDWDLTADHGPNPATHPGFIPIMETADASTFSAQSTIEGTKINAKQLPVKYRITNSTANLQTTSFVVFNHEIMRRLPGVEAVDKPGSTTIYGKRKKVESDYGLFSFVRTDEGDVLIDMPSFVIDTAYTFNGQEGQLIQLPMNFLAVDNNKYPWRVIKLKTLIGTNQDSTTIAAGAPVTFSANRTGYRRADADAAETKAIGLAVASTSVGAAVTVRETGSIVLADWTSVVGATELTPNAVYFLSTTAGQLTTTPPSGAGDIVQMIGYAINATTLRLQIGVPLLV